jgi:hypothetical protein
MMYHLDGRRRRQSLVYFGEPHETHLLLSDVAGAELEAGAHEVA